MTSQLPGVLDYKKKCGEHVALCKTVNYHVRIVCSRTFLLVWNAWPGRVSLNVAIKMLKIKNALTGNQS